MKRNIKPLNAKLLKSAFENSSWKDELNLVDNLDQEIDLESDEAKEYLSTPIQLNSSMTLFLCLEGKVEIGMGASTIEIKENQGIIGVGGMIGLMSNFYPGTKFINIIMDEKFYTPILSQVDATAIWRRTLVNPCFSLNPEESKEVLHIYRRVQECLNNNVHLSLQKEIARGYMQVLFLGIYAILLRNIDDEEKPQQTNRNQDLSNRFMMAIESHYRKERNIKYYADLLCITPKYLSQVVYKTTGYYAGEHINRLVINEAKMLIKSRQYTILQISDFLNFSCESFFCRYFKKHTGMTPLAFQRGDE